MENLIKKVFNDKMSDGSIENIIGKQIERAVESICSDLTSYSSEFYKIAKERLKPIILTAFEDSEFDKMTLKLTAIINEAMANPAIEEYKATLRHVHSLFGENTIISKLKDVKTIKLSQLFEEYCKYVSNECLYSDHYFDESDLEEDEFGKKFTYLDCSMKVAEKEIYFGWSKPSYNVEFSCETPEDLNIDVRFSLDWDYNGEALHILGNYRSLRLANLKRCPDFILFLWAIENNYIEIELDKRDEDDSVLVQFAL